MNTEDIVKILESEYGYIFPKKTDNNKYQSNFLCELIKDVNDVVKNNVVLPHVINWVDVKEQLPSNESKKYLVFRDKEIQFDKWIFDGTKGYWRDYLGITHWCEIPEPPYF